MTSLPPAAGSGSEGASRPRPVRVHACPDGPLLVRGPIEIVGEDGEVIAGARRTVALCRCGASTIKPFCDGTHRLIGFRTDPRLPQ